MTAPPCSLEVSLGLWQDRPPAEVLETAALADALGFRAIWIGEMATWDAFALGAHVGAALRHSNLVLGPFAVAVRDPMMIAMGAASVAALTGRTVGVALGTSSTVVVERWHGRDRVRSATALAESAQAVRALLDGSRADLDGAVVRSSGYRLRLPAPRSELAIAAFGEHAIRAAARHGDRVVLNLVDVDTVALLVEQVRAAAAEAGRPCPRVAVWVTAAVDHGPAAVEQLRRGVVGYLAAPGYSTMFTRAGFGELVAFAQTGPHPGALLARVPAELSRAVGLVGDAAHVEARIRAYLAAGADDVVIVPAATDEDPAGAHTLAVTAEIGKVLPG
ncbi:LLM class F420-dependent oxidoreductase [Pseudonocardia sp. GCM10023141]|uniref:LLM class F420-dependent oxidoreductase n=1 Tax=Pseudonocardia sp. GCM10023141 TaxID=3252653 RepID=UPI003612A107